MKIEEINLILEKIKKKKKVKTFDSGLTPQQKLIRKQQMQHHRDKERLENEKEVALEFLKKSGMPDEYAKRMVGIKPRKMFNTPVSPTFNQEKAIEQAKKDKAEIDAIIKRLDKDPDPKYKRKSGVTPDSDMIQCASCGEIKHKDEFHKSSASNTKRQQDCKVCQKLRSVLTQKYGPEKALEIRQNLRSTWKK